MRRQVSAEPIVQFFQLGLCPLRDLYHVIAVAYAHEQLGSLSLPGWPFYEGTPDVVETKRSQDAAAVQAVTYEEMHLPLREIELHAIAHPSDRDPEKRDAPCKDNCSGGHGVPTEARETVRFRFKDACQGPGNQRNRADRGHPLNQWRPIPQ